MTRRSSHVAGGLKWIVTWWVMIFVILSMLLSVVAVSTHHLADRERRALTRLRRALQSAPATSAQRPLVIAQVALEGVFSVTEHSRYRSPHRPLERPLSSAPLLTSFSSRVTIYRLHHTRSFHPLTPLSYEIGIPRAPYNQGGQGGSGDVAEPHHLIIRAQSVGISGQLSALWADQDWVFVLQALIIACFALTLAQRRLIAPLLGLTKLAQDLRASDLTPEPNISQATPELLTLQEGLLQLHRELRHEQRSLASAYSKLQTQERLTTVGFLSARVMHELGNPLASVSGLLEYLRDDPQADSQQRELLELALQELWRMRDTSRTLLRFARPERGGEVDHSVDLLPISIGDLIEWARFMLRYHESYHSVALEVTGPMELEVQSCGHHLKHTLLNLILNAARAQSAIGSIWIDIAEMSAPSSAQLTATPQRESRLGVQITVIDQGPGVEPMSDLKSLSDQSAGLGLSIARESVEGIGGRLWINRDDFDIEAHSDHLVSRYPGARFSIWIPLTPLGQRPQDH